MRLIASDFSSFDSETLNSDGAFTRESSRANLNIGKLASNVKINFHSIKAE